MYIVHWPRRGPTWAWPGMERARELGFTRSIGVSNFSASELEMLTAGGYVSGHQSGRLQSVQVPASAAGFLSAARRRLEAYSPLGTARNLASAKVNEIARRVGRTPAQVLLRWCVQHEVPVVTKSTHRERIAENAQIFDFALSAEHVAELDALDQTARPTARSKKGGGETAPQAGCALSAWQAALSAVAAMAAAKISAKVRVCGGAAGFCRRQMRA